jgi:hypothetical protein
LYTGKFERGERCGERNGRMGKEKKRRRRKEKGKKENEKS